MVAVLTLLLPPGAAAVAEAPAPLVLHYEAYAAGIPVLTLDFRLAEQPAAYEVSGFIKAVGILRLFSSYTLNTESRGGIAADDLHPAHHDTASGSRGRERHVRLDYRGDGTVSAVLNPPEDPGRPVPSARQIIGTVDPLTAILAMSRSFRQTGRCGVTVPVFDGRRRYDLVLTDEGAEPVGAAAGDAYRGVARRCHVDMVKIAGFSWDRDYSPHTNHGRVWIAEPRPGAPPLPVRLDFASDWGPITVKILRVDAAK
jgi:hypothetical protein